MMSILKSEIPVGKAKIIVLLFCSLFSYFRFNVSVVANIMTKTKATHTLFFFIVEKISVSLFFYCQTKNVEQY